MSDNELTLRYGCNPHQVPAGVKVWRRGYNRVTISRSPDAVPATTFIVYALRAGASKP